MKNLLLPTLTLCLITSSCHHKDLCYMHSHETSLELVYDWSDENPVSMPAGMCAYFYPDDREGEFRRFDFPGAKGGPLELNAGEYKIITYNNDTEAVQFSAKENFGGHVAFTRTGDMLEPLYGNGVKSSLQGDDGQRIVITPDNLFGCSATEIGIDGQGSRAGGGEVTADADGNQTVTLHPRDLLCHYSFEVRNVSNAGQIERVSASLSGMAGEMILADESLGEECVTLPVSAEANGVTNTITGSFLTFGHNKSNAASHKMAFYIVMNNGTKYSVKDLPKLDVTDQVDFASDPRHVHIIIDGIDLPDSPGDDSGFNPTVDDWGVINEDIDL